VLATQEHLRTDGRTVVVWHKADEPEQCNGECDFHPIACSSDEGIVAPGGLRDVPVELDEPGQRWCSTCVAIIRNGKEV
jgi:hypothetical protein